MAILERKIIHEIDTSCSHIIYPQFVLPRHKHAEYEIMLFTQGSGKQFVGEGVADFQEGDIALIGSNVPHLHLCNSKLNPVANTILRILGRLTECRNIKLLSDVAYNGSNRLLEVNEPVNKVYTYLFNHFKEKVLLQEVADYVKQNPSALCRYFKQRTDKSIFQCLAEIRIEHACKLLSYSNLSVSQIAFESGFNSVPYFIKQFQSITEKTPGEYRELIGR